MFTALLAAGFLAGWSLVDLAIAVVVLAAVVALVYVALRQFGIAIPAWFQQVVWIVIVAVVVVVAIKFIASL
jgi:ethanolamine transporter EutH